LQDNASKLKCCLNFEFDCYVDAQKGFPSRDISLETQEGTAYFMKMEVHKGIYWYDTTLIQQQILSRYLSIE